MKKIYFAIAACAIFAFAACNNATETTPADSMADTTKTEEPAPAPAAPADSMANDSAAPAAPAAPAAAEKK